MTPISRGLPPLQAAVRAVEIPTTEPELQIRQIFGGGMLLGWSIWELANAARINVKRALMLKHRIAWMDDAAVIAACRKALADAGVSFLGLSGVALSGESPPRRGMEPRRTIDHAHRTLWCEREYSIYAEWEYALFAWPGGFYPVGRHYGDCTCGLANLDRGWCVTGGAGLTVTIFEDGCPTGFAAVDPKRVLHYTVGSTGVPQDVEVTPLEEQDFLIGKIGPQDILWLDAVWKDRDSADSDLVYAASSSGDVLELEVRTQGVRFVP